MVLKMQKQQEHSEFNVLVVVSSPSTSSVVPGSNPTQTAANFWIGFSVPTLIVEFSLPLKILPCLLSIQELGPEEVVIITQDK